MPVRSRRFLALAFLLVLGAANPAGAQAPGFQARLDSLFTVLEAHGRMMGSVAVRKGGRIVYQRTIGFRDSAQAGWMTADGETAYRIGSVTKPFTAAMIYQLVDEGRLGLEMPLSRFFPRIPGADSITIRDLLGHTSGLPDYIAGMDLAVPADRGALLERIASRPAEFTPGTRRRYSNSNYLLLGYIVEAVTGASYEQRLRERVAAPAGLRRTYVAGTGAKDGNAARAYFFADGHWAAQPDHAPGNAGGAGAIVSTPADLTLFLSRLFDGGLVSAAGLREMTTGFQEGERRWGKGLSPFQIASVGRTGFSHDGSIGAFAALAGYVPDDSLAVAITFNGQNYPRNRVFFHVWDLLYGVARPLPTFDPVPLAESDAAALAGVYAADAYGLVITIRRAGDGLEAQTEGQDPFPLTHVGEHRFVYRRDGILIEFAEPAGGVAPRFHLFQQFAAVPLERRTP